MQNTEGIGLVLPQMPNFGNSATPQMPNFGIARTMATSTLGPRCWRQIKPDEMKDNTIK